jgi:hypothetical protein
MGEAWLMMEMPAETLRKSTPPEGVKLPMVERLA